MPLTDIGPRAYHQLTGVATSSFTPQFDRAAKVRRILIDKVSASDVWIVSIQGRELARFDIQTTGNQQPLSGPYSGYPKTNDIFEMYNSIYNDEISYPVPLGQAFTVSSVGGATANITLVFTEYAPGEIQPGQVNHPQGNRMILPLVGYRAAAVTAAGEVPFDTQVGPSWFPNIFVDGILPPNWQFRILAMFLEGGGVNTFSGAADHRSTTTYLAVLRNGQRLFTRDALGGIPLLGQASAAGSANVVTANDESPFPPFQESDLFDWSQLEYPIVFGGGDQYQLRLGVTGDVTGGASYAAMRMLFLCDVRNPGAALA